MIAPGPKRDDDYLHNPVQIRARDASDLAAREPFQNALDFEAYNLGHLMTAACVHHRATGKSNLLDVAAKAADYLVAIARHPGPGYLAYIAVSTRRTTWGSSSSTGTHLPISGWPAP